MSVEKKKLPYRQVRVTRSVYEEFENLYPDLTRIYVERALLLACRKREVFDEIFWSVKLKEY